MDSQKARGIETDGNLIRRAKAYIPVMGPLVLNAITSVEEKSIAMDARAFSAPVEHSFLWDLPKPGMTEKKLVVLVDAWFIATIVLEDCVMAYIELKECDLYISVDETAGVENITASLNMEKFYGVIGENAGGKQHFVI